MKDLKKVSIHKLVGQYVLALFEIGANRVYFQELFVMDKANADEYGLELVENADRSVVVYNHQFTQEDEDYLKHYIEDDTRFEEEIAGYIRMKEKEYATNNKVLLERVDLTN